MVILVANIGPSEEPVVMKIMKSDTVQESDRAKRQNFEYSVEQRWLAGSAAG